MLLLRGGMQYMVFYCHRCRVTQYVAAGHAVMFCWLFVVVVCSMLYCGCTVVVCGSRSCCHVLVVVYSGGVHYVSYTVGVLWMFVAAGNAVMFWLLFIVVVCTMLYCGCTVVVCGMRSR